MSSRKRKSIADGGDDRRKRKTMDEDDDDGSDFEDESFLTTSDNSREAASEEPVPDPEVPPQAGEASDSEQSVPKETESVEKKDGGILLFSGNTNWDLAGRKSLPKHAKDAVGRNLWGPHKLVGLKGIRVSFVASGCSSPHNVIVTDEGKAMTWGRNDSGQLGHRDTKRRDDPFLVETLKEHCIVSAACGKSHTLFLSDRGTAYACGDNKMGQCGVGSQTPIINIPTKVTCSGRHITKVACGGEFSAIIDMKGTLYTFGLPEYGQLGHNADGKYFVTSSKLSFNCELVPRRVVAFIEKNREGQVTLVDDVKVIDVACGLNHCVVADIRKRCFSWGFGGYGRLGHAQPKDEMVPRLIKTFDGPNRGVKRVFAGSSYSMAINEYDLLYFWGQTKKSGEATMYPKPVQALTGWKVQDVACANTSIAVVADESLVTWGPSPTTGELCYGENRIKSSTVPQEVKPLEGLRVMQVACGYGHTLIIARDETEEEKAKLDKMPEFDPKDDL